ncbi:MAG: hypothetical protein Q8O22_04205, partial [Candidatus Omnitrophota bacterium]|nr:hypothetical protein [Candidatus Omnitrophota bacterium]
TAGFAAMANFWFPAILQILSPAGNMMLYFGLAEFISQCFSRIKGRQDRFDFIKLGVVILAYGWFFSIVWGWFYASYPALIPNEALSGKICRVAVDQTAGAVSSTLWTMLISGLYDKWKKGQMAGKNIRILLKERRTLLSEIWQEGMYGLLILVVFGRPIWCIVHYFNLNRVATAGDMVSAVAVVELCWTIIWIYVINRANPVKISSFVPKMVADSGMAIFFGYFILDGIILYLLCGFKLPLVLMSVELFVFGVLGIALAGLIHGNHGRAVGAMEPEVLPGPRKQPAAPLGGVNGDGKDCVSDPKPNINRANLRVIQSHLANNAKLADLDEGTITHLAQWIYGHRPYDNRSAFQKKLQEIGIAGVKRHHQEAIADSFKIGISRRKFFTVLGLGAAAAVYSASKVLDKVVSPARQRDWTETLNKIITERGALNQKITGQFLDAYPDERKFIEQINNNPDIVFANYVAEVYGYMMNSPAKNWKGGLIVDELRRDPFLITGLRLTPEALHQVERVMTDNRISGLVEKIVQCSNIKQPDKGLSVFDEMAVDCTAFRSAIQALDIIHLGRKHRRLVNRLIYYWKPASAVNTSDYVYLDLATGTNFEDYLPEILEHSPKRPVLLTDISPFILHFWHTLNRILNLGNIQVLDVDIRTASKKTVPVKVGTIRLQNVAHWVKDLSQEWVEQIFDLVEPGGQLILVQPVECLVQEGRSSPQQMEFTDLIKAVMLKDVDNAKLIVNLLQVVKKQEGKWNVFAGHVGKDGRFNRNQSGYYKTYPGSTPEIYNTVIVFQKLSDQGEFRGAVKDAGQGGHRHSESERPIIGVHAAAAQAGTDNGGNDIFNPPSHNELGGGRVAPGGTSRIVRIVSGICMAAVGICIYLARTGKSGVAPPLVAGKIMQAGIFSSFPPALAVLLVLGIIIGLLYWYWWKPNPQLRIQAVSFLRAHYNSVFILVILLTGGFAMAANLWFPSILRVLPPAVNMMLYFGLAEFLSQCFSRLKEQQQKFDFIKITLVVVAYGLFFSIVWGWFYASYPALIPNQALSGKICRVAVDQTAGAVSSTLWTMFISGLYDKWKKGRMAGKNIRTLLKERRTLLSEIWQEGMYGQLLLVIFGRPIWCAVHFRNLNRVAAAGDMVSAIAPVELCWTIIWIYIINLYTINRAKPAKISSFVPKVVAWSGMAIFFGYFIFDGIILYLLCGIKLPLVLMSVELFVFGVLGIVLAGLIHGNRGCAVGAIGPEVSPGPKKQSVAPAGEENSVGPPKISSPAPEYRSTLISPYMLGGPQKYRSSVILGHNSWFGFSSLDYLQGAPSWAGEIDRVSEYPGSEATSIPASSHLLISSPPAVASQTPEDSIIVFVRDFLAGENFKLQQSLQQLRRHDTSYPQVCAAASLVVQKLMETKFPADIIECRVAVAGPRSYRAFPTSYHAWIEFRTRTGRRGYASLMDGQFDLGFPEPAYKLDAFTVVPTAEYLSWYMSDPRHMRAIVLDITDDEAYERYVSGLGLDLSGLIYRDTLHMSFREDAERILEFYRNSGNSGNSGDTIRNLGGAGRGGRQDTTSDEDGSVFGSPMPNIPYIVGEICAEKPDITYEGLLAAIGERIGSALAMQPQIEEEIKTCWLNHAAPEGPGKNPNSNITNDSHAGKTAWWKRIIVFIISVCIIIGLIDCFTTSKLKKHFIEQKENPRALGSDGSDSSNPGKNDRDMEEKAPDLASRLIKEEYGVEIPAWWISAQGFPGTADEDTILATTPDGSQIRLKFDKAGSLISTAVKWADREEAQPADIQQGQEDQGRANGNEKLGDFFEWGNYREDSVRQEDNGGWEEVPVEPGDPARQNFIDELLERIKSGSNRNPDVPVQRKPVPDRRPGNFFYRDKNPGDKNSGGTMPNSGIPPEMRRYKGMVLLPFNMGRARNTKRGPAAPVGQALPAAGVASLNYLSRLRNSLGGRISNLSAKISKSLSRVTKGLFDCVSNARRKLSSASLHALIFSVVFSFWLFSLIRAISSLVSSGRMSLATSGSFNVSLSSLSSSSDMTGVNLPLTNASSMGLVSVLLISALIQILVSMTARSIITPAYSFYNAHNFRVRDGPAILQAPVYAGDKAFETGLPGLQGELPRQDDLLLQRQSFHQFLYLIWAEFQRDIVPHIKSLLIETKYILNRYIRQAKTARGVITILGILTLILLWPQIAGLFHPPAAAAAQGLAQYADSGWLLGLVCMAGGMRVSGDSRRAAPERQKEKLSRSRAMIDRILDAQDLRAARKFGLDTRPVENKLIDFAPVGLFMSIRGMVNPDNKNRIGFYEGIHFYYQKAAGNMPQRYADYLPTIARAIKEEGFLITDDVADDAGQYCNPDELLEKYRFTKDDEIFSKQLWLWRGQILKRMEWYESSGYGWRLNVRKRLANGVNGDVPPGAIPDSSKPNKNNGLPNTPKNCRAIDPLWIFGVYFTVWLLFGALFGWNWAVPFKILFVWNLLKVALIIGAYGIYIIFGHGPPMTLHQMLYKPIANPNGYTHPASKYLLPIYNVFFHETCHLFINPDCHPLMQEFTAHTLDIFGCFFPRAMPAAVSVRACSCRQTAPSETNIQPMQHSMDELNVPSSTAPAGRTPAEEGYSQCRACLSGGSVTGHVVNLAARLIKHIKTESVRVGLTELFDAKKDSISHAVDILAAAINSGIETEDRAMFGLTREIEILARAWPNRATEITESQRQAVSEADMVLGLFYSKHNIPYHSILADVYFIRDLKRVVGHACDGKMISGYGIILMDFDLYSGSRGNFKLARDIGHEGIHANSIGYAQDGLNEGFTEYFTRLAFGSCSSDWYPCEERDVSKIINRIGFEAAFRIFFFGDFTTIIIAHNTGRTFQGKNSGKNSGDTIPDLGKSTDVLSACRAIDALWAAGAHVGFGYIFGALFGWGWAVPFILISSWNLLKVILIIRAFILYTGYARAPPMTLAQLFYTPIAQPNKSYHPAARFLSIYNVNFHEAGHFYVDSQNRFLQEFILHTIDFLGCIFKAAMPVFIAADPFYSRPAHAAPFNIGAHFMDTQDDAGEGGSAAMEGRDKKDNSQIVKRGASSIGRGKKGPSRISGISICIATDQPAIVGPGPESGVPHLLSIGRSPSLDEAEFLRPILEALGPFNEETGWYIHVLRLPTATRELRWDIGFSILGDNHCREDIFITGTNLQGPFAVAGRYRTGWDSCEFEVAKGISREVLPRMCLGALFRIIDGCKQQGLMVTKRENGTPSQLENLISSGGQRLSPFSFEGTKKQDAIILVPREIKPNEGRVGLLPWRMKKLLEYAREHKIKLEIYVESRAGALCGTKDEYYGMNGATVIENREKLEQIGEQAAKDGKQVIILKVNKPLDMRAGRERVNEFAYLGPGKVSISFFDFASDRKMAKRLLATGVDCLALEAIEAEAHSCLLFDPADPDNIIPYWLRMIKVRRGRTHVCSDVMNIVSGIQAAFQAVIYLNEDEERISRGKVRGNRERRDAILHIRPWSYSDREENLKGKHLLITGAGTAGLAACGAGLLLGATVTLCDLPGNLDELRRIFQAKIKTGQMETISNRQRTKLASALAGADAVIGAAALAGKKTPITINKGLIIKVSDKFPKRRVFVDLAINAGGNFDFVKPDKTVACNLKEKLTHGNNPVRVGYGNSLFYMVAGMSRCPGAVSFLASSMLEAARLPYLKLLLLYGLRGAVYRDSGFAAGMSVIGGTLTDSTVGKRLGVGHLDVYEALKINERLGGGAIRRKGIGSASVVVVLACVVVLLLVLACYFGATFCKPVLQLNCNTGLQYICSLFYPRGPEALATMGALGLVCWIPGGLGGKSERKNAGAAPAGRGDRGQFCHNSMVDNGPGRKGPADAAVQPIAPPDAQPPGPPDALPDGGGTGLPQEHSDLGGALEVNAPIEVITPLDSHEQIVPLIEEWHRAHPNKRLLIFNFDSHSDKMAGEDADALDYNWGMKVEEMGMAWVIHFGSQYLSMDYRMKDNLWSLPERKEEILRQIRALNGRYDEIWLTIDY